MPVPPADPKLADEITLFPNLRILKSHTACEMMADGTTAGIAAPRYVLSAWAEALLVRAWLLHGRSVPRTAGAVELMASWERAVLEDPPRGPANSLPREAELRALADQARQADRLLRQWTDQAPAESRATSLQKSFSRWRTRVAEAHGQQGVYTAEDWLSALVAELQAGCGPAVWLPKGVRLVGFREHSPLEQRVIDALQECGVRVRVAPRAAAGRATLARCDDVDSELRAAAAWAGTRWAAGARRVGVAVNGLDGLLDRVRDAFDLEFGAGARLAFQDGSDAPYHLSRGQPLSEFEVVGDARLLLELSAGGTRRAWPVARMSRFLLSRCWMAADEEQAARARLERAIRHHKRPRWSLRDLAAFAGRRGESEHLPVLLERTARMPQRWRGGSAAQRMHSALRHWGWPGPVRPDPVLHDVVSALTGILEQIDRLSGLDDPGARRWLDVLLSNHRVTVRGGEFSPVQVVTPEDAAVDRYDALWVCNLRADNWPGRPAHNPFLPAEHVERLPRTTEEWMLREAEALTAELRSSAAEVVFSWSAAEGDVPHAPSRLLAGLEHGQVPDAPATLADRAWPQIHALGDGSGHPWLRERNEDPAPSLPDGSRIEGGSGVLALQAACPLAAFLRYRLGARHDPLPGPFPDAGERGSLAHAALETLYRGPAGEGRMPCRADVAAAVNQALSGAGLERRLPAALLAAERTCLEQLLAEWLEHDLDRGVRVEQVERRVEGRFGPLLLRVQLDRTERLPGGGLAVLDYKTASKAPIQSHWDGARVLSPQVPMYAVQLAREPGGEPPAAAGIAHLKRGACRVIGRGREQAAGYTGRKDFAELLTRWADAVDALAAEFGNGMAANVVYEEKALKHRRLDLVLRHSEGHRWSARHG